MPTITRRQFAGMTAALALPVAAQPAEPLYREKYRPQFHFSPKKGWTNDPNGLVFYKGQYHLFFQHNPFDVKWGNMTWGHAVSPDLFHWTQLEHALLPDGMGTMFSGSAVVDEENTAGFERGGEKTIVLIYTAAGDTSPESKGQPFTQCLAYSTDGGRTFTKYAGNPVVPNIVGSNRDPKVVWYAPARRWIMTLFLDANTYGLLSSRDLKKWALIQTFGVPQTSECPDFFEMPVEDSPGESKWVWTGANGNYLVGSFDGSRFVPEVMTQCVHSGANYYAVQTYSGLPGKRRVQVAWMSGGRYPDMPFNQQMSCPYEFRLRKYGYKSCRIFAEPVRELEPLRATPMTWTNRTIEPGETKIQTEDALDIVAEIEPGSAKHIGFRVRGRTVACQAKGRDFSLTNGDLSGPLRLHDGRFKLRVLVDRASIEVFGNDGEAVIPSCYLPEDGKGVALFAEGGTARVVSLAVYPLRSVWPDHRG